MIASAAAPASQGTWTTAPAIRSASKAIEFIDIEFTDLAASDVLRQVRARAPAAPFAYIVTPNVDHLVRLQRSRSDLWPVYRNAWMTLCDSQVLARMAHWMREGELPVFPGSDLTAQMFQSVIKPDDRVAIVGGKRGEVEALARRYGLRDVRHFDPPLGFIHNPTAVAHAAQFVVDSRARYVFLAVGSPQQEMLAHRIHRTRRAAGIGFCVGASLDFLTGVQKRAPALMQRFAIEWLYRLGTEPRRLYRRYLIDGPEIFRIARYWHARAH